MNSGIIHHYAKKGSEAYTPIGVRTLFGEAVKDEAGSIEAVLKNKHKYKNLVELWYASFLAFAIHKWLKRKFSLNIPESDPPDVLFLDEVSGEAFPVEIMELFDYKEKQFDGDYKKLAEKIWDTKGVTDLNNCHLLLVNRIKSDEINISKLLQEMRSLAWKFERIWLGVFTASNFSWTFFEMFSFNQSGMPARIEVSTKSKEDMAYYY